MVREIVIYGDPVLVKKCAPVTEVTEGVRTLAQDMVETMRAAEGVGLAAPQVGVSLQLAVVDVTEAKTPGTFLKIDGEPAALAEWMPLIFLNPTLEFPGREKEVMSEGCLSFPELRADVVRPAEVKAHLTLLDGRKIVLETDGLLSRAIQHESDHLNGILFITRTSATAKLSLRKKIRLMQEKWGTSWNPAEQTLEE